MNPCRPWPQREPREPVAQRAPDRAAGLAGVRRPARGAGVFDHRHDPAGTPFRARPGGAGDRRLGLHLGLRRSDGRGARDRADRGPAVRRRQAARVRPAAAPGDVAGARAVGARLHAAVVPAAVSEPVAGVARGGGESARLPRRARLRLA